MIEVIEIDNLDVTDKENWLLKAEPIHRQLRPLLPENYTEKMSRVYQGGGRTIIAVKENKVEGIAVYRIYENTASGVHLYVDDLVTNEANRSQGVGKLLLCHLQNLALKNNCEVLTLDSATHRLGAHKFYFREGYSILAFHFAKYFRN
jgi:GNAT superfamily N-acetyltransferase